MKTKLCIFVLLTLATFFVNITYGQFIVQRVNLNANNINCYVQNTGIWAQNTALQNSPGFEWPKGSGNHAIFTAGLTLAAMVNDSLRMCAASFKGESYPGYMLNGVPLRNSNFKLYLVNRGDNASNNPDWANWGLMVPYGAPFVDVNGNHVYDPLVDTPGVRGAAQTIFGCLTDGFDSTHTTGEGFGGGIKPLKFEMHWTAWCYTQAPYQDIQFMKFEIINKNNSPWNRTFASIICDPDLGDSQDDYIGCDTIRDLGYCYNFDNNDADYGTAPPASGFLLLKGIENRNIAPPVKYGMSSFTFFTNTLSSPPPCESDPNGEPMPAYRLLQGYKKDSSNFIDVTKTPRVPTKFCYYGDPETNTGWTESKGARQNCGGDNGVEVSVNPPGDRRFIMSSGSNALTINPNDTQTVIMAQLVARGTSNLNSVTKLKQLADVSKILYDSNFVIGVNRISDIVPANYQLHQNYPNPFNPTTKIKFEIPASSVVKLAVYDITGKEVALLVNNRLSMGQYEYEFNAENFSSGVYFYKLITENFTSIKKMVLLK